MEVLGDVVNLVSVGNTGLKSVKCNVKKPERLIFAKAYIIFKENIELVHSINQCYHGFNQVTTDGMRKGLLFFFAEPIQM